MRRLCTVLSIALLAGCGSTVTSPDASTGDASVADRVAPVDPDYAPYAPASARPTAISLGGNHACARFDNGRVYCWGNGFFGGLGNGVSVTAQPRPTAVRGLRDVSAVTSGATFTCALSGSAASCWGSNAWGQLGDGTRRDGLYAAPVVGLPANVRALSAGGALLVGDACALLDDTRVLCWGSNTDQSASERVPLLGVGETSETVTTPSLVRDLTNVQQVSIGDVHICARLVDGTVRCWGWNNHAQCGRDGAMTIGAPSTVAGLDGVVEVAAGQFHTCARRRDGSVSCWGDNTWGQLGDSASSQRAAPAPVTTVTGATQVATGDDFSCALIANGAVTCWGRNRHGQLGDGTTSDARSPVMVRDLTGATMISLGDEHACALLADRAVRCWGRNDLAQLGDASRTDRLTPVVVAF